MGHSSCKGPRRKNKGDVFIQRESSTIKDLDHGKEQRPRGLGPSHDPCAVRKFANGSISVTICDNEYQDVTRVPLSVFPLKPSLRRN